VQDRGPYIYGRLFDLNPTTRAALGCPGLCDVRWSIVRS
jgi:rare lipoprotein A (peptidoglycan hydrolase)